MRARALGLELAANPCWYVAIVYGYLFKCEHVFVDVKWAKNNNRRSSVTHIQIITIHL